MTRNGIRAIIVLVALAYASAAVTFLKTTTYSDSSCTTTDGSFVSQAITGNCDAVNIYNSCFNTGGIYTKGECSSRDPLQDTAGLAVLVQYSNKDCVPASDIPYTIAWAGPLNTCFGVPSASAYMFQGCSGNSDITLNSYPSKSVCGVSGQELVIDAGTSPNCKNSDVSGSELFYCPNVIPLPPAPPVATPVDAGTPVNPSTPSATPVKNNTPTAGSSPVAGPQSTPGKVKASSAVSVRIGIATFVTLLALA